MQICFGVARKIEIDDYIHSLNIDTSSKQIRADQITTSSFAEIMKNPITMTLCHAWMDVIAGIAYFCDFLCQKFHTLCWITKNYRLIDLKLKKFKW